MANERRVIYVRRKVGPEPVDSAEAADYTVGWWQVPWLSANGSGGFILEEPETLSDTGG